MEKHKIVTIVIALLLPVVGGIAGYMFNPYSFDGLVIVEELSEGYYNVTIIEPLNYPSINVTLSYTPNYNFHRGVNDYKNGSLIVPILREATLTVPAESGEYRYTVYMYKWGIILGASIASLIAGIIGIILNRNDDLWQIITVGLVLLSLSATILVNFHNVKIIPHF